MAKNEKSFGQGIFTFLFIVIAFILATGPALQAQQIPAAWSGPLPDVGLEFETHSYQTAVDDIVNPPNVKLTIDLPKGWQIMPVSSGYAAIDKSLPFNFTGKEYRYQFPVVSAGIIAKTIVPVEGEDVVSSQVFDYGPFKVQRTQMTPYGNKKLHSMNLNLVYRSLRFNIGIEVLEEHNHLQRIAILDRIARSLTIDGQGGPAAATNVSSAAAIAEPPVAGKEPPPVAAPEKVAGQVDKRSVDGTWESTYGPITFEHEAITSQKIIPVKGTWVQTADISGEFTGTYDVAAGMIHADYKTAWVGGKISWKLSEDGFSLKGEAKDKSGKSEWNATRELFEDNSSELSLNAEWKSNFGPLRIKHGTIGSQKKIKIVGYWGQKPSQGTFAGEYDVENGEVNIDYFQPWNNEKGTATWKLSPDRKQLNGTYDQGPGGSGNWNLSR